MDKWDAAYARGSGLRWWPDGELVRFIGSTYGFVPFVQTVLGNPCALDLGCGTGRNTWLLAEAGFNVHATDSSQEAIDRAISYFNKRAKDLTRNEAAMIAACLPNPKRFTVKPLSAWVATRFVWIAQQMNNLHSDLDIQKIIEQ